MKNGQLVGKVKIPKFNSPHGKALDSAKSVYKKKKHTERLVNRANHQYALHVLSKYDAE